MYKVNLDDNLKNNWPYDNMFEESPRVGDINNTYTIRTEPTSLVTGWSSEYYTLPKGASELQDLIEHREMNFAVGNIFKAAYRLGLKSGIDTKYDLEKIIWFAQRELERLQKIT